MVDILSDEVVSKALVGLDAVLLITSGVGMFFVILRRKFHPLNQRSFTLVLIQNICMFLYPILSILDVTQAIPCWSAQTLLFANYSAFGSDLISITFRTFFKMRLIADTTDIISHQHATSLKTLHSESWFVRNATLLRDYYFVLGIFLMMVIGTTAFAIFGLRSDSYCVVGPHIVYIYSLLIGMHVLLDIFLWVLIEKASKNVSDGLHLKREAKTYAITWSVYFLVWMICYLMGKPLVGQLCLGIGWACFFWVTTGVTVIETFTHGSYKAAAIPESPRTRLLTDTSQTLSLEHVLRDPELHEQYKEFLKGEWSVENILFWEDIEKLKKTGQSETMAEECKRIYDIYFTKGSALELNLQTDIIAAVTRRVQEGSQLNPSIFAEAQEAAYILLRSDSFFRFKWHCRNQNRDV